MYKFVLDMANNHQGDVDHGKNIIKAIAALRLPKNAEFIIKFQYRQLDSFIHANADEQANKHIPRFKSTRLMPDDYLEMVDCCREHGFKTACTPFDEASVPVIDSHGFDYLKIASCSISDWPLLEASVKLDKPLIVSTGGASYSDIDKVVSFLRHRDKTFSLMHCVSIYPTPNHQLNLLNIQRMLGRYQAPVGWSTHEDQDETLPLAVAMALGSTLFERHVGLPTDEITLNAYSSNPEQLQRWFDAFAQSQAMLGVTDRVVEESEAKSLDSLRRGAFAVRNISAGETLTDNDVYFAFPLSDGGMPSGVFKANSLATTDIAKDLPITSENVELPVLPEDMVLKHAIHEIKGLLNEAGVKLPKDFSVEFSHHEGVPNFRKVGTTLINIVNEEYCKKLIVQLAGQFHPTHEHSGKSESFTLLHGDLSVELDGKVYDMTPGDRLDIKVGQKHNFNSVGGAIVEELSTRDIGDSLYADQAIAKLQRNERKTRVTNWGRDELNV